MKRFLLTWLALTAGLLLGTVPVSYLVFHRLDVRYAAFFQLLVIPAFQAAVLMWVSRARSVGGAPYVVRQVRGHRVVLGIMAIDAVVLGLGWMLSSRSVVGIAAEGGLQPAWIGAKTLAVAVALAVLAGGGALSGTDRVWLGLVALGALALGAEPFRPWLGTVPDRVLPPALPTILRWLVVYGGCFVLCIAALVHTGTVLRRRSAVAGSLLELTLGVAFAAGLITGLGIFLRPYLAQPWAGVVRTCLSLAATFTLAACLSALSPREPVSA